MTTARRAILAHARMELLMLSRRGENVLVTLAVPLGILVFFSKVDAVATELERPVDFLVPGVLALSVMASAMVSLGITTGFERRYGVLKRLGATPLSRGGLLAAKTISVLVLELLQVVLVVATATALGWTVPGGIVPGVALLLVGTVAFAGTGLLLAGTLRAEANLAATNAAFLVLLFLGGMAYPLDDLPGSLEAVARLLPAAALSESVRAALTSSGSPPTADLVTLLAWAALAPLAAARWFRWEE
jgi:ABC-2 type transport system permease protein